MPQARKKRESFGAIRTLPSGRLQASYTGLDGKRYNAPHTFDTKTDARGWLSVQQSKLHTGTWSPYEAARSLSAKSARTDTLGAFAADWLSTRMNRNGEPLRDRTRVEYERLLNGPLQLLAGERIVALSPGMIRAWYSAQIDAGTKTQTARAYGLLKSILATAVQDGRILTNPCMIRGGQNAKTQRKIEPPTPAELSKMIELMTPRYKAAVVIAAWAGCRWGELTELRRRDITVTDEIVVIPVTRAVTKTTGVGFKVGKPKSDAGVRAIALPPHVNHYVIEHLSTYVDDSPDALLFHSADGTHLAQSTFGKHWYPVRAKVGREDMPWHALRHHGATRAALAGATLKELQERLGHSTVAAAMGYQHSAGRDTELARRMSELSVQDSMT